MGPALEMIKKIANQRDGKVRYHPLDLPFVELSWLSIAHQPLLSRVGNVNLIFVLTFYYIFDLNFDFLTFNFALVVWRSDCC